MDEAATAFTGWVTALARAHTKAMAEVARAEGLRRDEALDAVQEALTTFLILPQARSIVGDEEDSRALLRVIVRNAARNIRRRHHRARPHASLEDSDNALPDTMPSTEELIVQAEEHIRLLGCVSRLNDVQNNVVTLRMLEEASGAEVARMLELEPGHVAVLLHRAKKELRDCMETGMP